MKIILTPDAFNGKVFLDDGTDITNDLAITKIEIKAKVGDIVTAIITLFPSEVVAEVGNQLVLKKHPDWEIIKKLPGQYEKFIYPNKVVLADNFGRGI